jgi:flagellar biosynthetic protein FliQ
MDQVIDLSRQTLQIAFWTSAPILAIAVVISLLISILQVMTSMQDVTVVTVPRLAAVAGAAFVLMPWMLRHLMGFTIHLFSDFHPYVR